MVELFDIMKTENKVAELFAREIVYDWEAYFDRVKSIGKVYDSYCDVFTEFKFLNDKMTEDFCIPIALIHRCQTNQFKITEKEEEGWQVLMCNARFIFGDQPCRFRIVDPNQHNNA